MLAFREFISVLKLTALFVLVMSVSARANDAKVEFFEKKIRPVLVQHCYKCHARSAKSIRGGLLLDSKEGVQAGGESGAAVVAGKPKDSLLLSALRHESYEMPPDRKLPANVIADFEKWILDGAVDPRVGGHVIERQKIDMKKGSQFWSFQPISKPDPPKDGSDWAVSDIDRFVADRHKAADVRPAGDASPNQIVRRLYFDLIGLPPTVDQIRDFVARRDQDADAALDETVNELLASPQFGERWGRHWLDVVRFAESSGGGRSLMFPQAWRFREYVIKSFNEDKPVDQLIREHIAGDLLPYETDAQHDDQVTGVGYLALGPTNYELQDKELLQMEVVDEQIDTIGRTFLGLTLGCARCHDHKFDPVPTSDYYAMAGILRSTQTLLPGNVSQYVTTDLRAAADSMAVQEWQSRTDVLQTEIKELKSRIREPRTAVERQIHPQTLPGIIVDETSAKFVGEWKRSTMLAPFVGPSYFHDDFKKTGRSVRFEKQLPSSGDYLVRMSHNYQPSRCSRLPVSVQHAGGSTSVEIDQRQVPPDGVFAEIGTFRFTADKPAVVTIDAEKSGPGVVIVDAIQFLPVVRKDELSTQEKKQQRRLGIELTKLEAELKKHQKAKPSIPNVMGVRDQAEPADWHIHIRGGIRNLGPVVPRGFVSVAGRLDESGRTLPTSIAEGQSGRLEMAQWLTEPSNPLTARVFVNRVWLHLTGEGLVRTPDNFGRMGQQPTHPELLDYLASTFVEEDHWSVKRLVKRIVQSRTYRLSSAVSTDQANADPDNRLLTRAPRRRLEAEAIRDAILQISGQLILEENGLTIEKVTQYDNGYDHNSFSRNMRSVYVPFFRNSMLEIFEIFDIANPNLVTGKRNVSTLPAQSLYMLNSSFVLEQSKKAAQHFVKNQSVDPGAIELMLDEASWKVVGHSVSADERKVLLEFLADRDLSAAESWAPVFQALFASIDFRYLD